MTVEEMIAAVAESTEESRPGAIAQARAAGATWEQIGTALCSTVDRLETRQQVMAALAMTTDRYQLHVVARARSLNPPMSWQSIADVLGRAQGNVHRSFSSKLEVDVQVRPKAPDA